MRTIFAVLAVSAVSAVEADPVPVSAAKLSLLAAPSDAGAEKLTARLDTEPYSAVS